MQEGGGRERGKCHRHRPERSCGDVFCWWKGGLVGSLTTRSYIFVFLGLSLEEITLRSTFDREVERGEKKKKRYKG